MGVFLCSVRNRDKNRRGKARKKDWGEQDRSLAAMALGNKTTSTREVFCFQCPESRYTTAGFLPSRRIVTGSTGHKPSCDDEWKRKDLREGGLLFPVPGIPPNNGGTGRTTKSFSSETQETQNHPEGWFWFLRARNRIPTQSVGISLVPYNGTCSTWVMVNL